MEEYKYWESEKDAGVGGPEAPLVPQIQLEHTPISVNNPENSPKIGRTNATTNCREETILKKGGRAKMR